MFSEARFRAYLTYAVVGLVCNNFALSFVALVVTARFIVPPVPRVFALRRAPSAGVRLDGREYVFMAHPIETVPT